MKLYLASGNLHKAGEFQALAETIPLGGFRRIDIVPASAVGGMPPVVEDAGTFVGNARKKAGALRPRIPAEGWTLADDSGLCVDALDGEPGVESAYYAGPEGDGAANLAKLVQAMRGVPEARRGAHFVCVLLAIDPAGEEHVFDGRCNGRLLDEPRGFGGFGYDPVFVPEGHTRSLAELGNAAKNALSHRARAWKKLAAWVKVRGSG